jgi:hypothetical protein
MSLSSLHVRSHVIIAAVAVLLLSGCTITETRTVIGGTPQPNYIYKDALTENGHGWPNDAHCSAKSDGYHDKDGYLCFAPTHTLTNAIATVTVKQISGILTHGYGLIFRHVSTGNYYQFVIAANGQWAFTSVVNGKLIYLADFQASDQIKQGLNVTNTLQVKAIEQRYIFFVNGTQVGQYTDSTFITAGKWGIRTGNNIETVFTDFSLVQP